MCKHLRNIELFKLKDVQSSGWQIEVHLIHFKDIGNIQYQ